MKDTNVIEMVEVRPNYFVSVKETNNVVNKHGIFKLSEEDLAKGFKEDKPANKQVFSRSGFKDSLLW